MSDLGTFVALQARVYEFLEQQEEAALRAILDRTAQLAVVRRDHERGQVRAASRADTPVGLGSAPSDPTMIAPVRDPQQAARALSRLSSEQERRAWLNDAGLSVPQLQETAKQRNLTNYRKLRKAELIDLLANDIPAHTKSAGEARSSASSERTAVPHRPQPSAETVQQAVDAAGIASHLRATETETDGAEFLREQHLNRESLLAVAAELQLTRVDRLSHTELEKRVLKQAIGARRKFSGLRRW